MPLAVTTLVHFIWPSSDDIVAPDIPHLESSKGINDHCRWLLESVLIQLVVIATRTCSYSTELKSLAAATSTYQPSTVQLHRLTDHKDAVAWRALWCC